MVKSKYLIIGNGIAGTTAAENIRKNDSQAQITIVTNENTPFYARIRLHEYIAGEISKDQLVVRKENWYQDKDIDLLTGVQISAIDIDEKLAIAEDGRRFEYDKLLYSAGSHSFVPRINGNNLDGVFSLRSIDDADRIIEYKNGKSSAVILGGGLLGLEIGFSMIQSGMEVTVVELSDHLLPKQLDKEAGAFLKMQMEKMGFNFILGDSATEIIAKNSSCVDRVLLKSGVVISTDMVLISAGVRPNIALAKNSGIDINLGLLVNKNMQTSVTDVYAAGDLIEFDNRLYGSWMIAMEQGKLAAQNMTGINTDYQGSVMSMMLKVVGIELGSVGNHDPDHELESKIIHTEESFKRIVFDQGRVVGCVMIGDKKGLGPISRHIVQKDLVADIDPSLIELSS
ncbi:MAG: NAD(P)/FAD-dependent oxidoreductase [Gammaproteobacteria bacterium]|nr:MAG: NAD(P)/FAD-dependent oxidoreductase [Gammaproteobacteria bacterium]